MSAAFAVHRPGAAIASSSAAPGYSAASNSMVEPVVNEPTSSRSAFMPMAATAVAALISLSARRRRASAQKCPLVPSTLGGGAGWPTSRRGAATGPQRRELAVPRVLAALRGLPAALRRTGCVTGRRSSASAQAVEDKDAEHFAYASRMVKIFVVVTFIPFLFCMRNFFDYNPLLSDFNLEYGPHLASPWLRATSMIQAIMIGIAIWWREKNKDVPFDRLFSWLFVPEGICHILLHYLNHHNCVGNLAFGYAFSAGIALPGFLSLIAYCPKNKVFPWLYMALYLVTQVPICNGLTDMVSPAKMRLNYANLNTATITGPFFYGILKRWKDIPKLPVFLACAVIGYQVTMGIIGPINSGVALKLYDPSVVFQHGVVDIGFGIAYGASIYYGLFRPGRGWNAPA